VRIRVGTQLRRIKISNFFGHGTEFDAMLLLLAGKILFSAMLLLEEQLISQNN